MANTSTDSSNSSTNDSSDNEKIKDVLKKLKKKIKKVEKKTEKHLKKKKKKKKSKKSKKEHKEKYTEPIRQTTSHINEKSSNIPIYLMEKSKAMAPMTKEEWEKRQSVVRRVLDEETGRYRLIKGDGEVLEEIVSQKRHKEINQQATKADGDFFQSSLINGKK